MLKHEPFIERRPRHHMWGVFRDQNHFFQAYSAAANTFDPNQRLDRKYHARRRSTRRMLVSSITPSAKLLFAAAL